MAKYLIYFNQQWVGDHSEEWFRGRVRPSLAVTDEMKAAGVYVFAGGLEENAPVYHADATGESLLVTDGPYAETKEFLGGFAVVDVPDDETAKMWAAKLAVGCGWPQEVRRFGEVPELTNPDVGTGSPATVSEVLQRFNHAFVSHDPSEFADLIGDECVMEAIEPAPDGARYQGKDDCLAFWIALIEDRSLQFTPEQVDAPHDASSGRGTIRWQLRFGPGPRDYVRGVNVMRVRDGRIVEALGYGKTPAADDSPLADLSVDGRRSDQAGADSA
jgi:hypothetical protein